MAKATAPIAILFDMDGTLVDTEPLWVAAQFRLAEAAGASWTEADAEATIGTPMASSAAKLAHRGVPGTTATIIEALVDEVVGQVEQSMPWRPGAYELLTAVAEAGVPAALVTQAFSPLAERVAAAAPAGSLSVVLAGDDVARPKPDPHPYLRAMDRLGVNAEGAVAIEDSVPGVIAAEAAGLPVVVVSGMVPVPAGPRRHPIDSLEELTLARLAEIAGRTD